MVMLHFPEKLQESNLMSLLDRDRIIGDSIEDITEIDFKGKKAFTREYDLEKSLIYRIYSARGFEDNGDYYNSAFSYDRATRSALFLKFNTIAEICAKRAKALFLWLDDEKSFRYAEEREILARSRLHGKKITTDGYNWFQK